MKINTEHVFASVHSKGTVQQTQAPQCWAWWARRAMQLANHCYCWRQAIISIASFKCPRMDLMQQLWSREWGKQNMWKAEICRKVSCVRGRKQRRMLQTYRSNTTNCRMSHAFSYHRLQWILMDILSTSKCHSHMRVTGEKDHLRW